MDLYEVTAEGCHTPLSAPEIAELFHAGLFGRDLPCRQRGKSTWRTIDELFPLLKYESVSPSFPDRGAPSRDPILYALAGSIVTFVLCALVYFFWNQQTPILRERPADFPQNPRMLPAVARFTPAPSFSSISHPPVRSSSGSNLARLEAEKLQRQQTARENAVAADRSRANAERRRQEAEKAAGTDYHVPLDQDYAIRDSNLVATVRVHDNDVTSFDIWVNGAYYREVRKEKGITHSRTDETLVYSNGRASLYYVWEISGKLNHCLLRVREN